MASFKTDAATGVKPLVLPADGTVIASAVDIRFDATASIAANDIVELGSLPPGVKLVDFDLITDDIDTGATAAASIGVLNAAGTDLAITFKAGITTFQTGGVFRNDAAFADTGSGERRIALKFTGAAAGSLAGKKGLAVLKLRG